MEYYKLIMALLNYVLPLAIGLVRIYGFSEKILMDVSNVYQRHFRMLVTDVGLGLGCTFGQFYNILELSPTLSHQVSNVTNISIRFQNILHTVHRKSKSRSSIPNEENKFIDKQKFTSKFRRKSSFLQRLVTARWQCLTVNLH